MKINGISAVTLFVSDMKKSCEFYSKIPGFRLACGGPTNDFTTFEIGNIKRTYLNLELKTDTKKRDFGRVIFYKDDDYQERNLIRKKKRRYNDVYKRRYREK